MLTTDGCAQRRKRFWAALPDSLDFVIVGDPANLIYFANYCTSPFVFRSCDSAAVLVLEREKSTLIADKGVKVYLDKAYVDDVIAPVWYDGKHTAPHRQAFLVQNVLEFLTRLSGQQIGIEFGTVPGGIVAGLAEARPGTRFVTVDETIRSLRRAKDADEIALIRRSIKAGEAGHKAALEAIKPGMTELEAYLLVADAANEVANEQVIVYGDFASGPRCETERGGPPTLRKIEPGDLFLLDYSVIVHGYRGDFTNTFVVAGKPTDGQQRLFDACLAALAGGESALRAGATGRGIDQAVRAPLAASGLEHAYPSHSGHGIGLSHPEPPYFVAHSEDTIVVDDVVAIEPGLFIPGVGGMRFERNYLVTADGFENLTNHRLTLEP